MENIGLYCGNSQIILGENIIPDAQIIDFDLKVVEKCLTDFNFNKYQIKGDANKILEHIKNSCKVVESAGGYVLNNVGQSLVIFRKEKLRTEKRLNRRLLEKWRKKPEFPIQK